MKKTITKTAFLFALGLLCISALPASSYAAGDAPKPPHQDWSFNGMFGTYDRAALQRGFKVYQQVCAACHSMKHNYYRDLTAFYTEDQVKNIASQYTVMDGPNDEGEMYDRPAIPSDTFVSPYPNEKAAAYANGGAIPPDLSLIAKARVGGADYVYGILTGYEDGREEYLAHHKLLPGQNYNKYMPGHIIAMAAPLSDGMIAYEDGSPDTLDQYAKDVSHFLKWAADPYMEDRKRIGIRVLLFLIVFAGIMYAVKKKIWAEVH